MIVTSPFQLKKSVHINLNKNTHSEFRIKLFQKGLSMQEVFEHMACLIVDGDSYLEKKLQKLEYNKKFKIQDKKLISTDIDSIFEAIEHENPIHEDQK